MIRFLEGVVCGVLIGAVGLGPIKTTILLVADMVLDVVKHCQ